MGRMEPFNLSREAASVFFEKIIDRLWNEKPSPLSDDFKSKKDALEHLRKLWESDCNTSEALKR